MVESRRQLLSTLAGAVGTLVSAKLLGASQNPIPRPRQSPNAPTNQNAPLGLDGPRQDPATTQREIDRQNQAELRLEIQSLFSLAAELKEEIDHTNAMSTLSLSVVKKAQAIEKLAKQIKEKAKG